MKEMLTSNDIQVFMLKLADDIYSACDELTKLDSAIGDGDLGMTLTIGFKEIEKELKNKKFDSIKDVLLTCADAIEEKAASTFATLFTIMLRKAGKTAEPFEIVGTPEIAQMFASALAGVEKRGKAKIGDKTLLDSLIPAVEAFEKAKAENFGLAKASHKALEAAQKGAEATINMKAKTGRSAYFGERTVGEKDPGAAAIVLMIQSLNEYINE